VNRFERLFSLPQESLKPGELHIQNSYLAVLQEIQRSKVDPEVSGNLIYRRLLNLRETVHDQEHIIPARIPVGSADADKVLIYFNSLASVLAVPTNFVGFAFTGLVVVSHPENGEEVSPQKWCKDSSAVKKVADGFLSDLSYSVRSTIRLSGEQLVAEAA
jgi:hypothetical protein